MKLSDRPFDQQYSQQLADVSLLLMALSGRLLQQRSECACTEIHPCVHHATVRVELAQAVVHLGKAIRLLTVEDR